jgi:hypothetical protein
MNIDLPRANCCCIAPRGAYATIFVAASFVTMCFVNHGDTKPTSKKSLLENFDVED